MTRLVNKYGLPIAIVGLLLSTILESYQPFDQLFQSYFYSSDWLITKQLHKSIRLISYNAPKIFLGIIAGLALISALILRLKSRQLCAYAHWSKPLLLIAICIALIPLSQAGLKAVTGIYSPVDLLPYGGKHPHIGLLEQLWKYGAVAEGRSFPAGHASGGFALMALYFLPIKANLRLAGLGLGLLAGWSMGLYQIARGEHFLSHTLFTMFAAWLIILLLAKLLKINPNNPSLTALP